MANQNNKINTEALEHKAINNLLIFVVGQPDKDHYQVIVDKDGMVIETHTAFQVATDEQCHWSQDFGESTIAGMYKPFWGLGEENIRKACSKGGAIFSLKDFMHGKRPQIKNWMTGSQFKLTIEGLSAKMEALDPKKSRKSCQALVDKMLKVNREHPADGLPLGKLRKFSKLIKVPKELRKDYAD